MGDSVVGGVAAGTSTGRDVSGVVVDSGVVSGGSKDGAVPIVVIIVAVDVGDGVVAAIDAAVTTDGVPVTGGSDNPDTSVVIISVDEFSVLDAIGTVDFAATIDAAEVVVFNNSVVDGFAAAVGSADTSDVSAVIGTVPGFDVDCIVDGNCNIEAIAWGATKFDASVSFDGCVDIDGIDGCLADFIVDNIDGLVILKLLLGVPQNSMLQSLSMVVLILMVLMVVLLISLLIILMV